jgi:deazaflavin-dependent oxidoreductase (nitroreductase family)
VLGHRLSDHPPRQGEPPPMSDNAPPSMNDFNGKIIEEFRANGGKVGPPFEGAPMILVNHTGAKSGRSYTTPLVYLPDGEDWVIIASKAGAPTHPDWYHNLKAHPDVTIEVGTEKVAAKATEVTGAERDELYARQVAVMPGFAEYAEKAGRVIPVIRLTRA